MGYGCSGFLWFAYFVLEMPLAVLIINPCFIVHLALEFGRLFISANKMNHNIDSNLSWRGCIMSTMYTWQPTFKYDWIMNIIVVQANCIITKTCYFSLWQHHLRVSIKCTVYSKNIGFIAPNPIGLIILLFNYDGVCMHDLLFIILLTSLGWLTY